MPSSHTTAPCDLAGRGVLVTRPAAQAEDLCRLVEAAGGRAIRFPAVAIEPIKEPGPAQGSLAQRWDLILFISRNAVEHSLALFPNGRLPDDQRLAAVGAATARALTDAGRAPDLIPKDRFDSEALLALAQLQDLTGQRVLIVRGVGGRALLGDTLRERGAELAYAEVYRRVTPALDCGPLLESWRQKVHLVTVTSGEILDNLLAGLGERGREPLTSTPLVVVSKRTAEFAIRSGFSRVRVAERASDAAILVALCRLVEDVQDG